jgi:hypothetical protein
MSLFILALLVKTVLGSIPYQTYTSGLDPAPILYPSSWYISNFLPRSNHGGQIIYTTIFCNVIVDVNIGSYAVVDIPGFPGSPFKSQIITKLQPSTSDNTFNFDLPFPAINSITSFGPISIAVYYPFSPDGDVLARNSVYTSIAVLPSPPTVQIPIAYSSSATTSSIVSVHLDAVLEFSLHNYDFLILVAPMDFFFLHSTLTISSPQIQSFDIATIQNVRQNEFDVSNLLAFTYTTVGAPVSFAIDGIRAPNYIATNLVWTIKFFRYGTGSINCLFVATGPTSGLIAENVVISNWGPSNGYLPSVGDGIQTFTNFTMVINGYIPEGGNIAVTFTGMKIDNAYIAASESQSLIGATGTYVYATPWTSFVWKGATAPVVTASGLTLTASILIARSASITIATLSSFTSSAPTISSIIITSSTNDMIASLSSPYSTINYQSTNFNAIPSMTISIQTFTDNAGAYTLTNAYIAQDPTVNFTLYISATTTETLSENTNMTLSGPFSLDATVQDNLIAFNSGSVCVGNLSSGVTIACASNATYSNGYPRSFAFQSPVLASPIEFLLYAYNLTANNSVPTPATLPNFPSNMYTRYEVCFQYTVNGTVPYSNQVTYAYCQPLTIAMGPDSSSMALYCTSTGMKGIPTVFSVTPYVTLTALGTNSLTVKFEISVTGDPNFSQDLMSGLPSGSVLPTSVLATQAKVTILWNTSFPDTTNIYYTPITSPPSLPNTGFTFYFPFTALAPGATYTFRYYIYFIRTSDNAQFNVQTGTSSTSSASDSFSVNTAIQGTPISILPGTSSLSVDISFTPTINLADDFLSIILPIGFQIVNPSISITGSTTNPSLFVFNSSNSSYAYPSILALALTITGPVTITLTGISSPSWIPAGTYISIAAVNLGYCGDLVVNNLIAAAPTLTIAPGSLTPAKGTALALSSYPSGSFTLSLIVTSSATIVGDGLSTITVTTGINAGALTPVSYSIAAGSFQATGKYTGTGFTTSAKIKSTVAAGTYIIISLSNVPFIQKTFNGFTSISIDSLGVPQCSLAITHPLTLSYTPAGSNITSVSAFPNTAGAINVHFEITFSPSVSIPVNSVITITGDPFSIKDPDIRSNTWCSLGFNQAPKIVSSGLQLIARTNSSANSIITIRKDLAYTNPSVGNGWTITITNPAGLAIVSDPTGTKNINYAPLPSNILSAGVSGSIINAGETSYYTFSFMMSVNFLAAYSIVIDVPFYYDAYFGPTTTFTDNSYVAYLTATSITSSSPVCTVGHWIIACDLGFSVPSGTSIDISILGTNPSTAANSLSSVQGFSLYIVDTSSNIVAITQSISSITFAPPPKPLLDFKDIGLSTSRGFYSDYTFWFFSFESYTASSEISVKFPSNYNFAKDQTAYTSAVVGECLGSYYQSETKITNLKLSGCSINIDNTVTFRFSKVFTPGISNQIGLTVRHLTNPNATSGYNKLPSITQNSTVIYNTQDVLNSVLGFFDYWSGAFTLYSMTSSSNQWDSRSYPNLDSAIATFYFHCTDKNCITCFSTNLNSCNGCSSNYLLINGICCSPDQQYDSSTGACYSTACQDKNCLSCPGVNLGFCVTCSEGYTPVNGVCVFCGLNKYFNQTVGACYSTICDDGNCISCPITTLSLCIICNEGYHVTNGLCCKPNEYYNEAAKACHSTICDDGNCLSCPNDNLGFCSACSGAYQAVNGICIYVEPNEYYDKIADAIYSTKCEDETCLSCSSNDLKFCIECTGDYILMSGICCKPNEYYNETANACYSITCKDQNCASCTGKNLDVCSNCNENFKAINGICVFCGPNQYFNETAGLCYFCDQSCSTCSGTPDKCTTCYPFSTLYPNHTCICNKGYYWNGSDCSNTLFSAVYTIDENNVVTLTFTDQLQHDLTEGDIEVTIDGTPQIYEIINFDVEVYQLYITFVSPPMANQVLYITFIKNLISKTGSLLHGKTLEITLFVTQDLAKANKIANAKNEATQGIAIGLSVVFGSSFITFDPTSLFNFLNTAEIFSIIYLFNLPIAKTLSTFLYSIRIQKHLPNALEALLDQSLGKKMPDNYGDYGIKTNLVLVNSGVNLTFLILHGILYAVLKIMKSCPTKINKISNKILKNFEFRVFLRFWTQLYQDMLLDCIIEVSHNDFSTWLLIVDFIATVFLMVWHK